MISTLRKKDLGSEFLPPELINDAESPNLFILKTIAAAQILESPKLVNLQSSLELGETIAKKFCEFFSTTMENLRLRTDNSFARIRAHWGDENIPANIFNHTVLFFLHGFMVFQNSFDRS